MTDFETRVIQAQQTRDTARSSLSIAVGRVGMTQENQWSTSNGQQSLRALIESYVKAEAQAVVLQILKSEDFYIAMTRSAGAMELAV